MQELPRLTPAIERLLAGAVFRRRRRLILPLLTTDPEGFPRAALLTPGEVRALSPTRVSVAVLAASRTSINLIRRRQATLLLMSRGLAASIRLRAGRGRVSVSDPDRTIFPMTVFRVRLDEPIELAEGDVTLLAGPAFGGAGAGRLFSAQLFEELAGLGAK